MRFNQLIVEANALNITKLPIEKLNVFIQKNCQPWLSQTDSGSYVAYRGIKEVDKYKAFVQKTRPDREPTDTEPGRHRIFNILLNYANSPANRSNSIFVTGSKVAASEYGKPFVLLPIGNFNYVWSNRYADWTRHMDYLELAKMLKPEVFGFVGDPDEIGNTPDTEEEMIAAFNKPSNLRYGVVDKIFRVNKELVRGIQSGHEIIIQCKSALYVDEAVYNGLKL